MTTLSTPTPVASHACLERNLRALAPHSPRIAQLIAQTPPSADIEFVETSEPGAVSAALGGRALASRKRPRQEGERLAQTIDLDEAGLIAAHGFALGYHVQALVERMGDQTVVIVYEPDVALLRAVLERIDHAGWLAKGLVRFVVDPADGPSITAALRGWEPPMSIGVAFLRHPPSQARLGDGPRRFDEGLARAIGVARTHVITTLMQSDVTMRNALMNVDRYLQSPGIADLKEACVGAPAIVVSAGPSLQRNIDVLAADPTIRERCLIIAVQTTLKPLLERGIRPHFVTALDYAEISKRFYEGLSPADVEGVTLIAEPKANPAIAGAFPGALRMPADGACDLILGAMGDERTGEARGQLPPGATVAHLAYYVARYLGADPVILMGQDLAFTDGQYYAAGASIHNVWACEVNPFNSIEQMEWERIVRMRGHLHEAVDHLGRRVYTDDQMTTYLAQFERDFADDGARGLRVVDATEGGVAKAGAEVMTLREALDVYAPAGAPRLPGLVAPRAPSSSADLVGLREALAGVRLDARRIGRLAREARAVLGKVKATPEADRANQLINRVHKLRDEATSLNPAWKLLGRLNQSGAMKRFRADRAIALAAHLDERERQNRQVDRDIVNLEWLSDMSEVLDDLLLAVDSVFDGGPRRTRERLAAMPGDSASEPPPPVRIAAVVPVEGAVDHARLAETLGRVAQIESVRSAIILAADPALIPTDLLGGVDGLEVIVHASATMACAEHAAARRATRAARAFGPSSWRGGIAHMTVFDELLDPFAIVEALGAHAYDSALLVGPEWDGLDPSTCERIVAQHAERPDHYQFTFSQAPPGVAGCVIARSMLDQMCEAQGGNAMFATLAGTLGYVPTNPRIDPIGRPSCVLIDETLRDAPPTDGVDVPREVIVEVTTSRERTGLRAGWHEHEDRPDMSPAELAATLRALTNPSRIALTFAGLGDPLNHPDILALIDTARDAGVGTIHVRTDLTCDPGLVREIIDRVDVVSVDLLANTAATYERITGHDRYRAALENCDLVLQARTLTRGMPSTWLVPRITRCDATYDEIEAFYDKWLLVAGAASIDPLPRAIDGERITPIPPPALCVRRARRERILILSDGRICADPDDLSGRSAIATIDDPRWLDMWRDSACADGGAL